MVFQWIPCVFHKVLGASWGVLAGFIGFQERSMGFQGDSGALQEVLGFLQGVSGNPSCVPGLFLGRSITSTIVAAIRPNIWLDS